MNIASIRPINFGRALTSEEKKGFKKVTEEARKELELEKTFATIFDFSFPSGKIDTGIGTSVSDEAHKVVEYLKVMNGINSIQLQPQGEISNYTRSPYSGTSFSLGSHIIDLTKLTTREYGNLLDKSALKDPYFNRTKDKETVNYDNIFAADGQSMYLRKAYEKFSKLSPKSALKMEFEKFKSENTYWLEKDALFNAEAYINGTDDMEKWPYEDQHVFDTKEGNSKIINVLKQVTDGYGNNVVEYSEFIQFIASKQLQESKEKYNAQGVDIYGDCNIGYSQKDFWGHRHAFYSDYKFGCDIGNHQYSCWSPAINLDHLESGSGELLYNKFDTFFKRYNGVRIDAAWQLADPLICKPLRDENGKAVFDEKGNELGEKLETQPNVGNLIDTIIQDAANNNNIPNDKIFLELLGGNSHKTLQKIKGNGMPLIHITRYAGDSWGRVKYYESEGNSIFQNLNPGDYVVYLGTHDDNTGIEQAVEGEGRARNLAQDLYINENNLAAYPHERYRAMVGELYTTKNQGATITDIMGTTRRINIPNTKEGNWEYRMPENYEKEQNEKLIEGKSINYADALSIALKAKYHGFSTELTNELDMYSAILKEAGPATTNEADKKLDTIW